MYELSEIIMDLLELCIELEEHHLRCECNCPFMDSYSEDGFMDSSVTMEELIQNIFEEGISWN